MTRPYVTWHIKVSITTATKLAYFDFGAWHMGLSNFFRGRWGGGILTGNKKSSFRLCNYLFEISPFSAFLLFS